MGTGQIPPLLLQNKILWILLSFLIIFYT